MPLFQGCVAMGDGTPPPNPIYPMDIILKSRKIFERPLLWGVVEWGKLKFVEYLQMKCVTVKMDRDYKRDFSLSIPGNQR